MLRLCVLIVLLCSTLAHSTWASTVQTIKQRGYLNCGINTDLLGFATMNNKGLWQGFDVEFCQAVASAVLGDKTKVRFHPLSTKERFDALRKGDIDLLARNTTWSLQRETQNAILFTAITYYDGQSFLTQKDNKIQQLQNLDGKKICVSEHTASQMHLTSYAQLSGIKLHPVLFPSLAATLTGFKEGQCDAITADRSALYALRAKLEAPQSVTVLSETIAKSPLSPAVKQSDIEWFNLV